MPVDHFDLKLRDAVVKYGDQPVPLWEVIHQIVESEHPGSRPARRRLVGRLMCRVRGLLREGTLVRCGTDGVRLGESVKEEKPPVAPQKVAENLPPSMTPTVADWFTFQTGGPRRRVFKA